MSLEEGQNFQILLVELFAVYPSIKNGLTYELVEAVIPFTVQDILKFTMDFGKNFSVLDVCKTWCTKCITPNASN